MSEDPLFVADVDGTTRRVAMTGSSDGQITWSTDGNTLYYVDMVPRADGMFDGATIQQYSLTTSAVRQAVYAVPMIPFFPSPDGSHLLVAGQSNLEHLTLDQSRNHMLDMASGAFVKIASDTPPVMEQWAGVWAPDGQHVALAPPVSTNSYTGPVSVSILAAPDWNAIQSPHASFSGHYTAMAWEDAQTLRVYDIVVGDYLTLTRLDTDGKTVDEARIILESPPAGTRYRYGRPVLSLDGKRALIWRQASDIVTDNLSGVRQFFLVEGNVLRPVPVSEDLEAIGWCDATRVLFLSGSGQQRRPVVMDVEQAVSKGAGAI